MSNEKTNQNDDLMYVSKQHNCAKNIIVSSEFRSNVITFFMGCIPWGKKKKNFKKVTSFTWSFYSVSSVSQSYLTPCNPMNRSTPGLLGPSPTPGVYPNSCPSSQ